MSTMKKLSELGTEFWNDSCDLDELKEAVDAGAVGATSNPVIVSAAVKKDSTHWTPVIDRLAHDYAKESEDEIAWRLIHEVGIQASQILAPKYEETKGAQGYLCVQVSPKYHNNAGAMVKHAEELATIAPNIAIKIPLTQAGVQAVEEVTAKGINVNATVSFSVAQAIAAAEAMERGIKRAGALGLDLNRLHPWVTIMVGRVGDQLKRVQDQHGCLADPGAFEWAGVAVFKKAYQVFKSKGFQAKLLVAAYRNRMQWCELVGDQVVQSIPYPWWKRFERSEMSLEKTIEREVAPAILDELLAFEDFEAAYNENGLSVEQFDQYGATVNTLQQFLGGYQTLLEQVRNRMVREAE